MDNKTKLLHIRKQILANLDANGDAIDLDLHVQLRAERDACKPRPKPVKRDTFGDMLLRLYD